MWIAFAAGSALFAALTGILAKIGVKQTDSTAATAIRTCVVLAFSWLLVAVKGEWRELSAIAGQPLSLLWIALSGAATGGSWLCYFRAIQLSDVNKVAPIDKSSALLSVLAAFIIFGEQPTAPKLIGTALMTAGLLFAVKPEARKPDAPKSAGRGWLFYAVLSAVFAALSSVLAKPGMENIGSNTATALRTVVVLVMSWVMVGVTAKKPLRERVAKRDMLFIILSGLATGCSWLCYFRALRDGEMSAVVVIDKMSLPLTVALSFLLLREKPRASVLAATALITLGALAMVL